MIPDPSVNVEDAVSRSIMKEFLYEALALLNEEDEAILWLLYLSDSPVSAKEYGEMDLWVTGAQKKDQGAKTAEKRLFSA